MRFPDNKQTNVQQANKQTIKCKKNYIEQLWWDWWISSTRELGPWEPSLPTNDVPHQKPVQLPLPLPIMFTPPSVMLAPPTNCPSKMSVTPFFCPNKNMFSPGPREYLTNHVCSASGRLVEEGLKNSTFHHSGALEKFSVILCVLIWFCIFFGNFLCLHRDNIWSNLEVESFLEHFWSKTLFWEIITYGTVLPVQIANCTNYQIKFCPSSMAT